VWKTAQASEPVAQNDEDIAASKIPVKIEQIDQEISDVLPKRDSTAMTSKLSMDNMLSTDSSFLPGNAFTPQMRNSEIDQVVMSLEEYDSQLDGRTPETSVVGSELKIDEEPSRSHAFTLTGPTGENRPLDPNEINDIVEPSITKEEPVEKSLSEPSSLNLEERKERTDRVVSESLGVEYFDSFINRQSALEGADRISTSLGGALSSFIEEEKMNWDSIREAVETSEITATPPPNHRPSDALPPSSFDMDGLTEEEDVQKAGDIIPVKGSGEMELADMNPPAWQDPDEFSDSEEMVTGKCLCFTTSKKQKKIRAVIKEEDYEKGTYLFNRPSALTVGPEIDSEAKGNGKIEAGVELDIVEVRSMHYQGDTRLRGQISHESSLHAGGWVSLASTSMQYAWAEKVEMEGAEEAVEVKEEVEEIEAVSEAVYTAQSSMSG